MSESSTIKTNNNSENAQNLLDHSAESNHDNGLINYRSSANILKRNATSFDNSYESNYRMNSPSGFEFSSSLNNHNSGKK